MTKVQDLTGQTFGRLSVIERAENRGGRRYWLCSCECGKQKEVEAQNLKSGRVLSCGCLRDSNMSRIGKTNQTHGQSVRETPEYRAWRHIVQRCCNPLHKQFKGYGGRGITVCDEWKNNFQSFFNYIGKRPSSKHSVDRINNNLGYEPNNVRWATTAEQNSNRRDNHVVEIDGVRYTLAEAIRLNGLRSNVVRQRLALGWTHERALSEPIVPRASRGIKRHENTRQRTNPTGRKPI